jgi:hypothetical protein
MRAIAEFNTLNECLRVTEIAVSAAAARKVNIWNRRFLLQQSLIGTYIFLPRNCHILHAQAALQMMSGPLFEEHRADTTPIRWTQLRRSIGEALIGDHERKAP